MAKILPSDDPNEIYVFGAVYVNAEPAEYLKLAMDVNRLGSLHQYLGVKKIGEPPSLSDLDGFRLESADVRNLRNCKAGDCDVQLPAEAIQVFRRRIDWSKPDAEGQVNREIQQYGTRCSTGVSTGGKWRAGTVSRSGPARRYFKILPGSAKPLERTSGVPSGTTQVLTRLSEG